jgi:hypothetical protein
LLFSDILVLPRANNFKPVTLIKIPASKTLPDFKSIPFSVKIAIEVVTIFAFLFLIALKNFQKKYLHKALRIAAFFAVYFYLKTDTQINQCINCIIN